MSVLALGRAQHFSLFLLACCQGRLRVEFSRDSGRCLGASPPPIVSISSFHPASPSIEPFSLYIYLSIFPLRGARSKICTPFTSVEWTKHGDSCSSSVRNVLSFTRFEDLGVRSGSKRASASLSPTRIQPTGHPQISRVGSS